MPRTKIGVPIPVLGIDVSKDGEFIDPRATPSCQNVSIERALLRKRQGTAALGTSASERLLAFPELKIGNTTYFLRIGITKVELLDKSAVTWASVSHGVLTGGSSTRVDHCFPTLSGAKILVFTNLIDNIRKYTGSGNDADLGGTPPQAKFCVSYGGYLVVAYVEDGGTTYYSRVQWSDTGNIEQWATGNAGTVDLTEDPGDIAGMELWSDYIAIHKETAIYLGYLVSTDDVFRFDRKNTGVGACSRFTIKNLPTGEQIFLARDGFHLFNGVTAPLIDSPLMDEIRSDLNPEYLHKCWSIVKNERDEYWCGLPLGNQTEPETVYKYNYRTGQVHKDVRSGVTAVGKYENSTQRTWNGISTAWEAETSSWNDISNLSLNDIITFGTSAGVVTAEASVNNDNGTAIDTRWESKDFTAKDIFGPNTPDDILVRWEALQLWARGNSLTMEYSTDSGNSWALIGTLSLDTNFPTDAEPAFGWFDVVSTRIRFRFSNAVAGETFAIKKFKIEAIAREAVR